MYRPRNLTLEPVTTSTTNTIRTNQRGGYKGKIKSEAESESESREIVNRIERSFMIPKNKYYGSGDEYQKLQAVDTFLYNYCNGNGNGNGNIIPNINIADVLKMLEGTDTTNFNINENDTWGRKLLFKILNNGEIPQGFFEKLKNQNPFPQGQLYLFLLWCCLKEENPLEKLKECFIFLSSQNLQNLTSKTTDVAAEAAKAILASLHPDVFDMNLLLNNCHSQGYFRILENLSESLCQGMHHSYLSSKEEGNLNSYEWFTLMSVYVIQILGNKRDLNNLIPELMKRFGSYSLNDKQLKFFAELALYSNNPLNCSLYPSFLKRFIDLNSEISEKADRLSISSSSIGIFSLDDLKIDWPNLFQKKDVLELVNTQCWRHDKRNTINNTNPGTIIFFYVERIPVLNKNNEEISIEYPTLIVSDTSNEGDIIHPKEIKRQGRYFTSAKGGGISTFSNSGSPDDFKGGYPISKDYLSFMGYLHHPHSRFKNRYVNLSINNDKNKYIFLDDEINFYTRGLKLFLVPMTYEYERTVNHSQINEIGEFLKNYIFFV